MKKIISIFMSCLLLFNFMTQVGAKNVNEIEQIPNRPKVSIIVPVYKVEPWLRECMDSLVNQTLKEIEIICVDDGSPDRCGEILDRYAAKDNRVKVVQQKNQGVSVARNVGLDIAIGEYIAFVDPDDYVERNTYEVAYKYAKKDDVDILNFKARWFKDGQDDHVNKLNLSDSAVISISDYIKNTVIQGYIWRNLYKSEVIQKVRFLPEVKYLEDVIFKYMLLGVARTIKSIPAVFYNYRIRTGSVVRTQSYKTAFITFITNYVKSIYDFWEKNNCLKDNEHTFLNLICNWIKNKHRWTKNYAQELLNSFGTDVLRNSGNLDKCSLRVQKELKFLKQAAECNNYKYKNQKKR